MKKLALIVAAMASIGISGTSLAVPVAVDYTFTIDSTFGGFPGPATIQGHAVYDDVGGGPYASMGQYALLSHDVIVNGVSHSTAPYPFGGGGSQITFQDDVPISPPVDRVSLFSSFN